MKQRLVGAAVLVIAAVVFVPMLLTQDEEPTARIVQSEPAVGEGTASVGGASDADAGEAITRALEPLEPEQDRADTDAVAKAVPAPQPKEPATGKSAPEKSPAKKTPDKQAVAKKAPAQPPPTGFAVQIGSFTQPGNAHGLRDKLKARGYAAFARSSGSVTRVYVGPQKSRAAAEQMRDKLGREMKIKGIVVSLPG